MTIRNELNAAHTLAVGSKENKSPLDFDAIKDDAKLNYIVHKSKIPPLFDIVGMLKINSE